MRTPAAVVVVTLALAAGCGGGGPAKAKSRSAYITEADAICRTLTPRLASIPRPSAATIRELKMGRITPSGFVNLAAWSGGTLRAARGPLARLSKLPTPADDSLLRRWHSLVRQTLADATALHTAALARDRKDLFHALAADERDSAAYVRLTRRLGFRVCGHTF